LNRPTRNEWLRCLQERVLVLADMPERERRHAELMESLELRTALPRHTLELAYELALEEGIDPALALELLACKVAVIDLAEPVPDDQSHSLAPPEWVVPVGLPNEALELEGRMRKTFRRLRTCLQQNAEIGQAIAAFASEPDVDSYDYQRSVEGV
jgi:hypothetical protein